MELNELLDESEKIGLAVLLMKTEEIMRVTESYIQEAQQNDCDFEHLAKIVELRKQFGRLFNKIEELIQSEDAKEFKEVKKEVVQNLEKFRDELVDEKKKKMETKLKTVNNKTIPTTPQDQPFVLKDHTKKGKEEGKKKKTEIKGKKTTKKEESETSSDDNNSKSQ